VFSGTRGGRGGSIHLQAASFIGHGHIVASGGDAASLSGGAGGRIEITINSTIDKFTGFMEANGGFMSNDKTKYVLFLRCRSS